ncbi:MAG TPA: gliding motility-associated ABC transporter substrate-binding protein GldG [Flavobacteriales bacterium]|nr:gliding motility-associated ABC transporter substrate-binding protein GldG [Flavobacteriales bacterium]HRJ36008.1 gliding motility-associated ABC transporter substrate-binding protein GldG [Flavobacteriales bacterium]HRJ38412.1 gliding motility-associated ABC transporter substrate-binding protein GldG [Flavobacteriales bacterium]
MLALLLKEIRGFLSSLIGYIVISVFLLLMGLFIWVFSTPFNILESGFADLDPLFNLAPLVFLFLIPAITMRSFAEEKRTGTIELLLTRPLSDVQIILAKYFAGLLLVLFTLLPTLLYYYTINQLGDPKGNVDTGGMWGSYLGLTMLSASFVSIGIFASAISQNQIISFILGVFLCFFVYLGFDFMGSYSIFGSFDSVIRDLGIYEHYHSISRGVIDSRDVIYFVSVVIVFVLLTRLVLESRKKIHRLQLVINLAIVLVVNILGTFGFFRLDLTQEKRHSLADATISFVENRLEDVITFQIYLTGELPADLKRIEREIKEKLDNMKAYAGDNIQYEFFDPYSIEDEKDRFAFMDQLDYERKIRFSILELEEAGKISQKFLFPGATVSYGTQQSVSFNFFSKQIIGKGENLKDLADATVNSIEYQLMDAMVRVTQPTRKRIAILEGHGEAHNDQLGIIINALGEFYAVERVKIDNKINAIRDFNALLIIQPDSVFSEKDKFVIDQFIMKGGKVAWFLDAMDVQRDTLMLRGQTFGIARDLNLDDQLFTYGVRINKEILLDYQCAPYAVGPGGVHEWYFYPLLKPERDHPITQSIDPIKTEYANTIDLVGNDPEQRKSILLKSSERSTAYKSPARINKGVIDLKDKLFNQKTNGKPVAVLLEGQFNSVFKDRLPPEFMNSPDYVFKDRSVKSRMLIVADGDIPVNEVDYQEVNGQTVPRYRKLHSDKYNIRNPDGSPRFIYGNKEFVLNAVDYLMGDTSLIDIRQRTVMIRRLNEDRVISERKYWQMVNVGLPILLIIAFGIGQNYYRRRKYTR